MANTARTEAEATRPRGTAQPAGNRWLLVGAGLLLQFSIGAVYAWSVFAKALQDAEPFQLSKVEASLPFTVTIAMIFVGTYTGGRIQDRKGPRIVALVGGVIYAIGIILASFARGADQLWLLIAGYGVISGFGLGFAYIVPIAMLQKWFPDKKGLITGLAVPDSGQIIYKGQDIAGKQPHAINRMGMGRTFQLTRLFETMTVLDPAKVDWRAVAEGKQKFWTASADDHGHVSYIRPPDGTPRRTVDRILAFYYPNTTRSTVWPTIPRRVRCSGNAWTCGTGFPRLRGAVSTSPAPRWTIPMRTLRS